jgi:lipoate-protein ligase A
MAWPTECRLLIDGPSPGAWNMAVDEALLEAAAHQETAYWRFYGWSEPTLSLGYFQDYAGRHRHEPSRHCPAVRRLTGGGAILHDAELTYSFAIPSRSRWGTQREGLYALVHGCLIESLGELGVAAQLCPGEPAAGPEPFLCFQRRAPGDVLLDRFKIAGSAQRRRRGAVLQHGSLLLRRSPAAPELPGLEDLAGQPIGVAAITTSWLDRLTQRLGIGWHPEPLDRDRADAARRLVATRYECPEWTERKASAGQDCF